MYPLACSDMTPSGDTWVFGYGSLIWQPSFSFLEQRPARIHGWSRRFWQGSHDHRGLPDAPGRVVTLIEDKHASCEGIAYLVAAATLKRVFEHLDYREKNGYERYNIQLDFLNEKKAPELGIMYIAPVDNHAFLGPASMEDMALQIQHSAGPSGSNLEYLTELAAALRHMQIHDQHVFELEEMVLALGR